MAYDLQEQEQLDELKAWWGKYGNLILTVLTIVLLGFAAFNGWRWYQRNQAAEASSVYTELDRAITAKEADRVKALSATLTDKYGSTVYAPIAALLAAHWFAQSGDMASARAQLQWVVDHSDRSEIAAIARVRLAGVLLDEKNYDEALKVLAGAASGTHEAAVLDRRGDVLFAQNKFDEARAAYREALAKANAEHPLRPIIQLKLDALPATAAS